MTDRGFHIARLDLMAKELELSARTQRTSDDSENGKRLAEKWEADVRALRWALHELENGA